MKVWVDFNSLIHWSASIQDCLNTASPLHAFRTCLNGYFVTRSGRLLDWMLNNQNYILNLNMGTYGNHYESDAKNRLFTADRLSTAHICPS